MPFGIGVTELVILLVALLIIFGPKRLPEMGRSLGKGMREFKDSISGQGRRRRARASTGLAVGAPPADEHRSRSEAARARHSLLAPRRTGPEASAAAPPSTGRKRRSSSILGELRQPAPDQPAHAGSGLSVAFAFRTTSSGG
jgi:sec-independent protein translocase protein TatA